MLEQPKPPDPKVVGDAHRLVAAGADREMLLAFLRDKGFDKIDSIKTVRVLYGLTMADAKELIDHSESWSDRFYSDMKFREMAIQALSYIAAENAKDPNALKITFAEPDKRER